MDAATYANGLREFADWIEANEPHITWELARADSDLFEFLLSATSRDQFADYVRMVGRGTKDVDDCWFSVRRSFGPIVVRVYVAREKVCKRVVKAVREVERNVRDPELLEQVPLVTITETVEDVEWVCDDSVLAGTQAAEVGVPE